MNDKENPPNGRSGLRLGGERPGFRGRIAAIEAAHSALGVPAEELESRLIELGFVEGASVEVLHEGPLGGDPIAVRVNGSTIALGRHAAMAVIVTGAESE
jgi:ferrous iron transport protein A